MATREFTTWLYRITANSAVHVRAKRRRRHRTEPLDAMLDEPAELRTEAQPEEMAEPSADLDQVGRALERPAAEAAGRSSC